MSPEHQTPTTVEPEAPGVALPPGVGAREATVLLEAFARVKERRFGRLAVTVSDGRVVDVELIEKMDRNQLRSFV
jgi:hypothetical protein